MHINMDLFIYIFPSAAILLKIHFSTPRQCLRWNRPIPGQFHRRHWLEMVASFSQVEDLTCEAEQTVGDQTCAVEQSVEAEWDFSGKGGTEMIHCVSLRSS